MGDDDYMLEDRLLRADKDIANEASDHAVSTSRHMSRWPSQKRSLGLPSPLVLWLALAASLLANAVMWMRVDLLDKDALCAAYTSQSHPPFLDSGAITYRTVLFNGSFAKPNIFRQPPSPEVDAAWLSLGTNYRPLIIDEGEQANKAGLNPGLLKRAPELGGGFPVQVEAMHHLHCLNLLRQALRWNYDYYKQQGTGAFANADGPLQAHTGHCLEILRQQLMCTADVNVFGQFWVKELDAAFPDFMTERTCKDFEAIRQWAHDGQVPEEQVRSERSIMRQPGDSVVESIP